MTISDAHTIEFTTYNHFNLNLNIANALKKITTSESKYGFLQA